LTDLGASAVAASASASNRFHETLASLEGISFTASSFFGFLSFRTFSFLTFGAFSETSYAFLVSVSVF
jgi:hypothetical protein